MAGKRGSVTAAELMAKLNADPAWVQAHSKREEERQRRETEFRIAEAPLIDELAKSGIEVKSAWDLVNSSQPYPAALPILLSHLQLSYPAAVREGIARALAVPAAAFGWPIYLSLFKRETDARVKDGLAVAIANTADESKIQEVLSLVRERSFGPSRMLLLRALEKSKTVHETVFVELDDDLELRPEIRNIMKRKKRRRGSASL